VKLIHAEYRCDTPYDHVVLRWDAAVQILDGSGSSKKEQPLPSLPKKRGPPLLDCNPKTRCPHCKGKGKVAGTIMTHECPTCKGTGIAK
jgi:RecJ-like exonuclease